MRGGTLMAIGAISFAAQAPGQQEAGDVSSNGRQRINDKVAELNRFPEEQALKRIAQWEAADPRSPEPCIIAANYFHQKALPPTGINIEASQDTGEVVPSKNGTDVATITDPKTGKQVGVIRGGPVGPAPDEATAQAYFTRASGELDKALKIAPHRLDIFLGRAAIARDAKDWKALCHALGQAARLVQEHPQQVRWLENQVPSSPPGQLAANAIHSNIAAAFQEKTKSGDERAESLIELGLKYFPDDVKLLNDMGTSHAFRNEWQQALPYYEKASKLAPEDPIVLGDLGRVYQKLNRPDKARAIAKKIIQLNNDPEAVDLANGILRQLNSH